MSITITDQVAKKAEQWGADMIVAHHPILFSPLKVLRTDDRHTQLCLRLVQAKVACFVAHTNLDVVPGGVNTLLAETLGLQEITPLFKIPNAGLVKLVTFVPDSHLVAVREALVAAGAGNIGNYSECSFSSEGTGTFRPSEGTNPFSGAKGILNEEAERRLEMVVPVFGQRAAIQALQDTHPYEEPAYEIIPLANTDPRFGLGARGTLPKALKLEDFARQVRRLLKVSHVRMVGRGVQRVKHVGVCGGSGGGQLGDVPGDIDVYVSGDLKYHESDDARSRGLALIDAGHVGTERGVAPHIAQYLKGAVPGITVKAHIEPEVFQPITD